MRNKLWMKTNYSWVVRLQRFAGDQQRRQMSVVAETQISMIGQYTSHASVYSGTKGTGIVS